MSVDDNAQTEVMKMPVFSELFNDPLADEVDWGAAESGGSSFGTYKLVKNEAYADRVEFKPTAIFIVLGIILICSGLVGGWFFGRGLFGARDAFSLINILPVVIFQFFTLVGISILVTGGKRKIFDIDAGYFWIGKRDFRNFDVSKKRNSKKTPIKLETIHAIQLIAEKCRFKSKDSGNSEFLSYEMNLVLSNGNRRNVVDHGNLKLIRSDADSLAEFLKVPVWDSIDYHVIDNDEDED